MKKWCPKCYTIIEEPGTSEMSKYAKYWRDNQCYQCNTKLEIRKENLSLTDTASQQKSSDARHVESHHNIDSSPYSRDVAPYALVKDEKGNVCGFWFCDSKRILKDAQRHNRARHAFLRALAIKHSLPEVIYAAIFYGDYRIVVNNEDDAGGCFVLLGSRPRPGEVVLGEVLHGLPAEKKWWRFWR